MRVVVLEADDVRIWFGAACNRLGEGQTRRIFSMALNKEGRKSFTSMRRALSVQSSMPRGAVSQAMRFKGATRSALVTTTSGTGRHLPLSVFGARQFSYGVRAKVWGRAQTFRSASWSRGLAMPCSSERARRGFRSSNSGVRRSLPKCCVIGRTTRGLTSTPECCLRPADWSGYCWQERKLEQRRVLATERRGAGLGAPFRGSE